jgi:methanogenic corrinoid protein MtbC1
MSNEHIDVADNYFVNLLSGNRKEASKICHHFLEDGNSIKSLYELVMKPALYKVGLKWERNEITVASEHLATAITEGILNELYSQVIPDAYSGKKVVLACVEKEEHQVGIKMVADVFELNGWESYFLGTGFPTSELVKFMKEVQPKLLAISLSVYFNFKNLRNMIQVINAQFPDLPILVGGQAFRQSSGNSLDEFKNIRYFPDLNELENYIITLK